MVIALQSRPSFSQGYATPQTGGLAYPSLWRGVVGAWLPSLGATGLTLRDHSGHANHGAITNFAITAAWADPNSLTFGGTDDYVSVPVSSGIGSLAGGTIAFWFERSTDVNAALFSASDISDASSDFTIAALATGDILDIRVRENGGTTLWIQTTETFAVGDRHHVAVTMGSLGSTVYVDGVVVSPSYVVGTAATQSWISAVADVDSIQYGVRIDSGGVELPFTGKMDDCLIYADRTLTPTEVRDLHRLGPAGIYRRQQFNPVVQTVAGANGTGIVRSVQKSRPSYSQGMASPEVGGLARPDLWRGVVGAWAPSLGATGTQLRDHSGKANHGTLTGFTLADGWADPAALTFDATDDYVSITNNDDLQLSGNYTVSVWATWSALTSSHLLGCYDNNGWVFLNITTTIYFARYGSDEASPFVVGPTLSTDTLYHLVMTYDGTTLTGYVDGKSVGTKSLSGFTSSANNVDYGRNATGSQYFDGTSDGVTIWNRALPASSIADLYRLGAGGMYRRQQFNPVVSTEAAATGRINSLVGVGGGMIGYGGGMIGRGY